MIQIKGLLKETIPALCLRDCYIKTIALNCTIAMFEFNIVLGKSFIQPIYLKAVQLPTGKYCRDVLFFIFHLSKSNTGLPKQFVFPP